MGVVLGAIALQLARGPISAWLALFPGLLAHEVAHLVLALLTRSRPQPLSVTPRRTAQGWQLGSVVFKPGMLSAGAVALAPLYVLPPLAWALLCWGSASDGLRGGIAGYVIVTLLWGAAPSRADWSIALHYPIGTLLVLAAIGATLLGLLGRSG
jgi:hypothetical protein